MLTTACTERALAVFGGTRFDANAISRPSGARTANLERFFQMLRLAQSLPNPSSYPKTGVERIYTNPALCLKEQISRDIQIDPACSPLVSTGMRMDVKPQTETA